MSIPKEKLLEFYRQMFLIRAFEEKLYYLFMTEPMPGTLHQYDGQEAIAVGVCAHLTKDDYIIGTHRSHGHAIAKGVPLRSIMAEMFAKKTGCCHGMGGSMHLADIEVGMLGATGIVGAGLPIAAGAGLSAKLRGINQVSVCFFGDGASNEGAFHEAVNLASIWNLPVIFVCENNLYGFSTPVNKVMKIKDISERARGYKIPGLTADGNDILVVYELAEEAILRARSDNGPTLLEFKTYRHKGHSRFEPSHYRPKEEIEEWIKRDPIILLKNKLKNELNILDKELEQIENKVKEDIEKAVTFARESPAPEPGESLKYLWA